MTIGFITFLGALGLCALSITSLITPSIFVFELPSHFQLQYFFAALLFGIVICFLNNIYKTTYCLTLIAIFVMLINILPWMKRTHISDEHWMPSDTHALSIIHLNVFKFNDQKDRTLDYIAQRDPDIFLISELTPQWADAFQAIETKWPYRSINAREDSYGMGIYSKYPLSNVTYDTPHRFPAPLAHFDIEKDNKKLHMIFLHPPAPVSQRAFDIRNAHFAHSKKLMRDNRIADMPTVVIGDFNTTAYSGFYKDMIRGSDFKNARRDRGFMNSWFGYFKSIYGLPIDHMLYNKCVKLQYFGLGEDVGSDHLPIEGRVEMRCEPY